MNVLLIVLTTQRDGFDEAALTQSEPVNVRAIIPLCSSNVLVIVTGTWLVVREPGTGLSFV